MVGVILVIMTLLGFVNMYKILISILFIGCISCGRPLTKNERIFLHEHFGPSLNLNVINLVEMPNYLQWVSSATSPWGNTIAMPASLFIDNNPSKEFGLTSDTAAALLAHEAFHVWQRQHGSFITIEGFILNAVRILTFDQFNPHYVPITNQQQTYINFLIGGVEEQAVIFQRLVEAHLDNDDKNIHRYYKVEWYVNHI
jgi:hypothetical protein